MLDHKNAPGLFLGAFLYPVLKVFLKTAEEHLSTLFFQETMVARKALSIRSRLFISMALMMLPLLILGGGAYYAIHVIVGTLGHMVEETIEELPRITQLKSLMMMAQMPPNDYLISGNPGEQNTFNYFVNQIDQGFFDLKNAPFSSDQEKFLAELVGENWQESRIKAESIFARSDIHSPETDALMRDFDATIGKAISLMTQLEREAYHEIEQQSSTANESRERVLQLIILLVLAGLVIGGGSGLLLARSILRPMRILRQSAEKFGKGELDERAMLPKQDEFFELAETFNSMALNLQRSQDFLQDMAIRDGLTGLLNRREFHLRLDQEVDRAQRQQSPLSLIMLDIDHFKKVNDNYGHMMGDEVLRGVATLLSKQIRAMDHLARYGGEEFVIVTPESVSGTKIMAERICKAVAAHRFMGQEERDLQVTISLGIANLPDHVRTGNNLIEKADQALYAAKNNGRNQVCIFGETPSPKATRPALKIIPLVDHQNGS